MLFIDARQIGFMKDRVLRDFTREDIAKIADTFHKWQADKDYEDPPPFSSRQRWKIFKKTTLC
ncbi:Type I restriction-modification system,DNA-methyltransferase subunit M [Cronobacter sakazakii 701]|nr:Type I restriction-modification system,DNA-methyltransferase subunit M [Cronobacter sakazakii 701]